MKPPIVDCPVKLDFERAMHSAKEFNLALRRLYRSLKRCDRCPSVDECPVKRNINQQMDMAIQQITEEWGLNC